MPGLNRAYSLLTVKEIDDDQRIIEGIATTPAPDRMGDIVEPDGAEYKLPIPLLWQHDAGQPIGHVISAKVGKAGITIKAKFAKIDEPGALKDRLDEAWQSVKAGLVRGLSIGFKPIESSRLDDNWSYRYIKWLWLELSAVTIPANGDCSITAVKSADHALLAASGKLQRTGVVHVKAAPPSPGASGTPKPTIPKGTNMTLAEMIAALEQKRAAHVTRMEALMTLSATEGRTLTPEELEEYGNLEADVKAIDEDLPRRRKHLETMARAAPVVPGSGAAPEASAAASRAAAAASAAGSIVAVASNLPKGVPFARLAMGLIRAKGRNGHAVEAVRADPYWMKTTPYLADVMSALVSKTAVNAGDTTTSGWASELVYAQNLASEFIEYLRPQTILGKFGQGGVTDLRHVPFNIRVGGQSAGATGYWVGQGAAIPLSRQTTTSVSLAIAKACGMVVIDEELARLSTPSAEMMVRDDLTNTLVQFLDDAFINPNNGGQTNISPASITYGVTPVTPTGTDYAALRTDIQTLMETPLDANLNPAQAVWIMSASCALKLSMMVTTLDQRVFPEMSLTGGRLFGLPVIVSQVAQIAGSPQFNDIIVLVHPQQILLADEGQIELDVSTQASIQMDDAPTNKSTATATGTSVVSMFQTNSMAIRAVRFMNWTKKRSTACQFIQAAAYK